MHLTADQFEYLKVWLEAEIGLVIESDQAFFVASRLYPLITRYGWNNYAPLIARLKDRTEYSLAQDVIESLLTHETSFFRDAHYFDELVSRTLPRIIERRASERRLAIWCAACSTGQEAYSIAMVLDECPPWPCERDDCARAVARSLRWARECRDIATDSGFLAEGHHVFAIVQGSTFDDLRREVLAVWG